MTDEILYIDSRVVGFSDQPMRIIGACFTATGLIHIEKEQSFSVENVPPDQRDDTFIVTDSPEYVQTWQLSFNTYEHLEQAITIFQQRNRASLVSIADSMKRYNPSHILQIRKIDKNGMQQEFDTSSLNNGHIAVLLAVWASAQISQSASVHSDHPDDVDHTLLPFSI